MKTLTLKLNDSAFKTLRSEVTGYNLAHAGEGTLLTNFVGRIIQAIEDSEGDLELKTRVEREREKKE